MRGLLCCATVFALACHDPLEARPSRVVGPRVLALQAEPAEARPGDLVHFRALIVDEGGERSDVAVRWAWCETGALAGDPRAVASECADRRELAIDGSGADIEARVPSAACERFGPNVAAGNRPADPDRTGGYYQPVRLDSDGLIAIGLLRVQCAAPNVPIDVALALRDRYRPNENPAIASLEASGLSFGPHDRMELRVVAAEASQERYVLYEAGRAALAARSERLRVSWYATAGELAHDRTDVIESDGTLEARTSWRAPSTPTRVTLWIVLRDDRGGVAFRSLALDPR